MRKFEKELDNFIKSLSVKGRKGSGKKHFYDDNGFLVLDFTMILGVAYADKSLFPMLVGFTDNQIKHAIVKVLNNNGHYVNEVEFHPPNYDKELFREIENDRGTDFALMWRFVNSF